MIESLALVNFRSFPKLNLKFKKNLSVIYGPNASGKTNLLEAIYFLSTTKSFRTSDQNLIHYHQPFFITQADFTNHNTEIRYKVDRGKSTKTSFINKVKKPLHTIPGLAPVVLFQPADVALFSAHQEARRRFLDTILSQADPNYLKAFKLYRHILRQRNKLLHGLKQKIINPQNLEDQIFIWDLQIAEPALYLASKRRQFLQVTQPVVANFYQEIANSVAKITTEYQTNIPPTQAEYLQILQTCRGKDKQLGFTYIGPQRDDFSLFFKNRPILETASRGETRTVLLSLKLAEVEFLKQALNKEPILLLDDVFSELDNTRRSYLLKNLKNQQTIITTTEVDSTIKPPAEWINVVKLYKNEPRAHQTRLTKKS